MKIMDLVEAVAPGCEVAFTGIRPGEKLHEVLVSSDEARHTVMTKDMFVIAPEMPLWGRTIPIEGDRLPDGFSFTSDTNDGWLSVEELRQMIKAS